MKKFLLLFSVLIITSCSPNVTEYVDDFLDIIDEPELFHEDMATIKLSTEAYGRLIKDYYSQEKDASYETLSSQYHSIQVKGNKLVRDITIKIKKGIDVKHDDYKLEIDALKKDINDLKNSYTSKTSSLSSINIDPKITKIGLQILKRLSKNHALKFYAKAFGRKHRISSFEDLQI